MRPLLLLLLVTSHLAAQATLFVDASATGPGSGTQSDPFAQVQQAINAAASSDEIIVAPGTYTEQIDFLGKDVHVRSSQGAALTVLEAKEIRPGGSGSPAPRP